MAQHRQKKEQLQLFVKNIPMKKILIIAAVLTATLANAQQQPLYSQYWQNGFVINPAVAGTLGYCEIKTVLRDQWTGLAEENGISQSPKTNTLSFNSGFAEKNIGLGAYIFSDKIGPVSKTGLSAAYAYHVKAGKESILSFGLSGMFYLYKLNTAALNFDAGTNTDNVLTTGNFKGFYPNMGAGIYLKGSNYFMGLSVPELIPTKISTSQDFFIVQEKQHYFFNGGVTMKMSDNVDLSPSFLVKYVSGAPAQVDANAIISLKKVFSLGASYRSGAAFVLMFGYKYKDVFQFGYGYDITTSGLSPYTKGTHEFMLAYNIHCKKKEEVKDPAPIEVPLVPAPVPEQK